VPSSFRPPSAAELFPRFARPVVAWQRLPSKSSPAPAAAASRYGDALKVQVAAPPERGKANEAVAELLATTLGLRPNQLALVQGHTQPRKVFQVSGIDQASLDAKLAGAIAAASD
jgi:uncharacterized protein